MRAQWNVTPFTRLSEKQRIRSLWRPCAAPSAARREYMRRYMAAYRLEHPGLSTPYVRRYRMRACAALDRDGESKPRNGAKYIAS